MNNIFILDGQTDEVLGHINKKYVIENEHEKDLPSHKDYFRFTVLGENKHAEHLNKRNGLIIPGEDGELLEFRIFESIKYRNNEGLFIEVHALATYLDLRNQKIFDPHKTNAETALQHANLALAGTEWQVGQVDYKGIRTLEFDNPFNSYDYILRIAREFELEPRFYVETDGSKVTGRYVDLIERIGEFRGRTIEFGRDLQKIERKEDTSEVVTALWVYGPQREDGTRLKVFVEDDEARQRWGRRGQHIIDYYEPQTENQDITEERLKTLGEMELRKRINAVVTYEAEILDLENVPGLENKKIRFGDTIRIKDTKFNPPLYVEARVFNVKRDVFNKANKTVQLGDFVEYTEEEVQAIWKLLQQQIQQKISAVQAEQMIEEYAEPKKVESPTPPPIDPEGDNPIWVDTSQEPYVPHVADTENNEWVRMTLSDDDVLVNEVNYNGLKWSKEEGLIVERSDGKVRSILNGTDGIKVQQKIGSEWVNVYYVDENGNVKFAGHLEGATGTFSGRLEGAWVEGGWIDLIGDDFTEKYHGQLDNTGLRFSYIGEYPETYTGYLHDSISYSRVYSGSSRNDYFTFDMDDARFTGNLTVAGRLTTDSNITAGSTSGYINLLPGNEHGYIEFYRSSGRAAYVGVPSAGSEHFDISADGLSGNIRLRGRHVFIEERLINPRAYEVTAQSPANVLVTSSGYFARSTSSKRYKADIQYNDIDYKKILKLQQASWVDRSEFENNNMSAEGLKRFYGAIAEDFEKIGLSEFVVYNENGEVENFSDRAWVLLIPNINDILEELEQIKERLERLENEGN